MCTEKKKSVFLNLKQNVAFFESYYMQAMSTLRYITKSNLHEHFSDINVWTCQIIKISPLLSFCNILLPTFKFD